MMIRKQVRSRGLPLASLFCDCELVHDRSMGELCEFDGSYVEKDRVIEVRRTVIEREEIIRLIRETDLASKTGHIWQLLYGEKLPGDVVQTILKVAEARNAFVHYKSTPYLSEAEERTEKRELQNLTQRAAAAVTQL